MFQIELVSRWMETTACRTYMYFDIVDIDYNSVVPTIKIMEESYATCHARMTITYPSFRLHANFRHQVI